MLPSCIFGLALLSSARSNKFEQVLSDNLLQNFDKSLQNLMHKQKLTAWDYETNLTDFNLEKKLEMDVELASFQKEALYNISRYNLRSISNIDKRTEFYLYLQLEEEILPPKKYKRIKELISQMINIYSTAQIFHDNPKMCDLTLNPDVDNKFCQFSSKDQLSDIWVERRNAVGPKCRDLFQEYVQLVNEAARMNGLTDASEYYLRQYTDPDIKKKFKHYNRRIRSLYEQLHAYVRFKLRQKYGKSISETGPIPAHLIGDPTAQKWNRIANVTLPYPEAYEDLSENLKQQEYTIIRIARLAEDFHRSLNLSRMPTSFWEKSVFNKPSDRVMTCHPSVWDFYDGQDFRLKACLKPDREGFEALHHWMGHIQYFLQYRGLPIKMRNAANDALFDAVGGALSLAALSLKHLKRVGLFRGEINEKVDINHLYTLALSRIVSFPATYAALSWKRKVLSGKIKPDHYNYEWWRLVEKYQGLQPPVPRCEKDFDPGNIFEIISGDSVLKNYAAMILQFQVFSELCEKAREFQIFHKPDHLHNCDIYESDNAGEALKKKMMNYGRARPWDVVVNHFLSYGVLFDQLNPVPMLEYFQPLHEWLKEENQRNGVHVGWTILNSAV